MSLVESDFNRVSDTSHTEKIRYGIQVANNSPVFVDCTEFYSAVIAARPLLKEHSAADMAISKQCLFRGEWFSVVHYVHNDRAQLPNVQDKLQKTRDQLQKINEQQERFACIQQALSAEIEKLAAEIEKLAAGLDA